jgi:DNA-binding NarL/FixJ family response regulator
MLGRVEEALAQADDGVRRARHHGQADQLRLWCTARCRIYLDAGRLGDARAEAEAVLAMSDELGPGNFDDITARYVLGRVALHTGDPEELARGEEFAVSIMRVEAGQIRRAGAWLAAQAAAEGGDHARAMELTTEAAGSYRRPACALSCPADPADEVALVRLALRAGDRGRAVLVTEFSETRVRDRLKGLGERRPRAVSGRPTAGWESLTASELQIVRLVAGGATNKQVADRLYLSPHTVSTHLWHAFTKLGISSRVELTRLVLEHEAACHN